MSKVVYLAGPITGESWEEANGWRENAKAWLRMSEISAISPLDGKFYLQGETKIADHYDDTLLSTKKAIREKDKFSVKQSDILIMNMLGAKIISGGSFIEAGWADIWNKPIILVMEESGNPNDHAMLTDIAAFRVDNLEDAIDIAKVLLGY